ncbi:MAG TPA: M20/M25/M40 family metallo-hydrolase [Candidatus Polarisedimenticolia bacterium]|nr:M20/M25/M40 family metallo-hydrolase [Candidatus Polarisedimenticolia bacterium]
MACLRGSARKGALSLLASLLCAVPTVPSAGAATADPLTLLQRYLRIDTSNPPGHEIDAAIFFKELLESHGIPATIYPCGPPEQRRANVIARLPATGPAPRAGRRALLLFNHLDVVQAERAGWSVDPFAGLARDGYIYGRGALDMKTTGLLQALALIRLKQDKVPLSRDVIFLGTADEEDGSTGMRWMLENHPRLFDEVELALTEGDNIRVERGAAGPAVQAWGVDVAEKLTAWIKLTAHGQGGHASVPTGEDNPVVRLVRALDRVSRHETPVTVLPSVAAYYAALADRFAPLPADKLRRLPVSLNEDAAFRAAFLSDPDRSATVRNTISITVLSGGPQTNVIPSTAFAHLDCRLLPGESVDRFFEEIRGVIADPNITLEPLLDAGVSVSPSSDSDLWRAILNVARRRAPGVPVVPSLLTSWTESSLLRPLGIQSYGFEPYALDEREVALSHADDERISADNVREGFEILYDIVKETAGPRAP